jgi:4a-hydroxytetrahydrobiopterin dehydratase
MTRRAPTPLARERCVPCRAGAPLLAAAEISALWGRLPGWTLSSKGGVRRLEKSYDFDDFGGALAFVARVGKMAEAQDHHPEVLLEWGRARVAWWTHKVRGLHRNDFICAAKTDALF